MKDQFLDTASAAVKNFVLDYQRKDVGINSHHTWYDLKRVRLSIRSSQARNALETTISLPVQLCYTHQYHMYHNELP